MRAGEDVFPGGRCSSSVAVAADMDNDGDLDLFIGGRVIPGRYPEVPDSRLLRNDRGRFTDVTDESAPGLRKCGMVTSALWSDVNRDSRMDLLIAVEWGPVKLFLNKGRTLEDQTQAAGLHRYAGWWNSMTGADVDGDGDVDYVVMNVGLNTKYGDPSREKPVKLYYGDLEGNGRNQILEAYYDGDSLVPVRGRNCVCQAMPTLADRFPTCRSFASGALSDMFPEKALTSAMALEATTLSSGVFLNDTREGDAKPAFTWRALPRLAQASPGYGVVATDLDGDTAVDIHAVQNLFTREARSTGLWRGGVGVNLHMDRQGQFVCVPPTRTGLVIAGDAKGLAVCDLNEDGWPDLVVTQNNNRLLAFQNTGLHGTKPLTLRLRGPVGNQTGVGARVTVAYEDGQTLGAEIYGGSGYLSQSSPALYFGRGRCAIKTIQVHWPGGRQTVLSPTEGAGTLVVEYPPP
jgi:hypothetical protein